MDLREIGNLFMVGFQGTRFSSELRDLIDDLNPCGVIHFSRNIESPRQTALLNRDLQKYVWERSDKGTLYWSGPGGRTGQATPGTVYLFPTGVDPCPGRKTRPGLSGNLLGSPLARSGWRGFNLDFVPVLDLLGDMKDPALSVIGDRSYGSDPHSVSRLGNIVVNTMRDAGVIPCCKHFPGHGGTEVDSHVDLPVDTRTAEALARADLMPFRDAAAHRVEMMMTAHVLYPALDTRHPATLSRRIVSGILREEMSYEGVVITDDLDMGAVANRFTMEESVLAAIDAGVDIMLICHSLEKALSARSTLAEAILQGRISEATIRRSSHRIQALKERYADSLLPIEIEPVRQHFNGEPECS